MLQVEAVGGKTMPSGSMHKVVIHKAGGYERLRLETHPVPKLGYRQVLIRTEAVGVNYADICVRWGLYESARRFVGWPITPGFEYSGWVEEVGREVKYVKPGIRFLVLLYSTATPRTCVLRQIWYGLNLRLWTLKPPLVSWPST
jgi:NADPH:quinone reductase-like Zn-dependent oxidoreductase